jgi:hypothetical protein
MSFPVQEFFTSFNTTIAFALVILVYGYRYFNKPSPQPKKTDTYASVIDSLDDETLECAVQQLESIIVDLYELQEQRKAQLI